MCRRREQDAATFPSGSGFFIHHHDAAIVRRDCSTPFQAFRSPANTTKLFPVPGPVLWTATTTMPLNGLAFGSQAFQSLIRCSGSVLGSFDAFFCAFP